VFPLPAPISGYGGTLTTLNASQPNGAWSLYVLDDCQVDSGSLAGWSVTVTTTNQPAGTTFAGGTLTIGDCCPATRASLYPSPITVSGATTPISGVTVTLNGLSHPYVADLNALLVGPGGQSALLMSDVGGAAAGANVTFSDAAGSPLDPTAPVMTGTYTPTDHAEECATTGSGDPFPPTAPPGPTYGTSLSVFDTLSGSDVNGVWNLYLVDDCGKDSGQVAGGWSLHIASGITVVSFSSFTASRSGAGVTLRWRTAQEKDVLGFNVYRGKLKLNKHLVQAKAKGALKGARYSFLDKKARRGTAYTYRLQAVGIDGSKRFTRTVHVPAGKVGTFADLMRSLNTLAAGPSTLGYVCALQKNGSMRVVANGTTCRKLETFYTVAPGPFYVCVQADDTARRVASDSGCPAPGTLLTLPPQTNDEFFCADSEGRLRHVGAPCTGGETSVVSVHVNNAPTNIALSPSAVDENQPSGTTVGNFSTTDPNSGDTFTYTFAGGVDDGQFTLSGANGGTLKTAFSFNYEVKPSYSIKIRSTDQGALFFEKTLTVSVNNVNEAPVNTVPGSQTVNEDTNLTFSSGNGNPLSIADVDAGSNPVKLSLDVLHGTLTLSSVVGLTFVDATANNTGSVHVTGTIANINTALAGLIYKGTANYNSTRGAETLTMVTNDQGQTGSGGALSDTDTVAITVTAVNDKPVAAAKSFTVQTNMKSNDLSGLLTGASDPDTGDGGYTASFTLASVTTVGGTCSGCTVTDVQTGGSFDVDPPGGSSGSLTLMYTITDSGSPGGGLTSDPQTITLTIAGPVIWFVDNTNGLDTNKGTLSSPFKTITQAATVDAASHRIFVFSAGTATGSIALNNDEWLIGQAATGLFDTFFGITPPAETIARPAMSTGTAPTNGTVTLATNAKVQGMAIVPLATGLAGSGGITGVSVTESSISATTGTAISLNNVSGTITLSDCSHIGAGTGIDLVGTHPAITITAGTIQNTTGTGISINGGSANFSYAGTITNSASRSLNVQNHTGGTLTFSGLITDSGSGINLSTNTGSTLNFTGGISATTGANTAFNATGGGTVNVSGTNNLTTTTGKGLNWNGDTSGSTATFNNVNSTTGIAVAAVDISSSGATDFTFNDVTSTTGMAAKIDTATGDFVFHAINANGATKGIQVTGFGGSFTVNGTGTTAGSGGAIQNAAQHGAAFNGTAASKVTLKNMNFTANGTNLSDPTTPSHCGDIFGTAFNTEAMCGAGISLTNVGSTGSAGSGTTLTNVTVSGGQQVGINVQGGANVTMTDCTVSGNGNQVSENGMQALNLAGTMTITDSDFTNNAANQIDATLISGATADLTFDINATVAGNSLIRGFTAWPTNGTSNAGIRLGSYAGARTLDFSATDVNYTNNFSAAFLIRTDTGGHMVFDVLRGVFSDNGMNIDMQGQGSGNMTYTVDDITTNVDPAHTSVGSFTFAKGATASGTWNGTIKNSDIGTAGTAKSGSPFTGLRLISGTSGSYTATVIDNTINEVGQHGIDMSTGKNISNDSGSFIWTLQNNKINAGISAPTGQAIFATSGTAVGDTSCVHATIGGAGALTNPITGTWSGSSIRLRNRESGSNFFVVGYGGSTVGDNSAAIATFVSGQNGGASTTATATDPSAVATPFNDHPACP
jgi:subtilisin-like proprotein convertase family protein